MINDGKNNVPEKTIAFFPNILFDGSYVENNRIKNILEKSGPKRSWFHSHFYRCLPLVIGNNYGFIIKSEFSFSFEWDGGDYPESTKLYIEEPLEEVSNKYPFIESHFGSGVITINPPFSLKTPPGINLFTINPPNYVIPNITVMSGAVETDNLTRNFTFNLKIQIPNIRVFVPANTPLAGFIPIPRYFADSFNIINGLDLFEKEELDHEYNSRIKFHKIREETIKQNKTVDRLYYNGIDAFGNKYKDHQKPKFRNDTIS